MLKQLRLTNIILVESAEIDFSEGFNVLSGETGSGKSAIMNAMALIAGERADPAVVRKGADKGIVEAVFDIKNQKVIVELLEKCGVDLEGEELYIRREISAAGKSRAFINHQLAQLAILKSVCTHLIHIVGQHANQDLLSLERHRDIVDLFGGFEEAIKLFTASWEKENAMQAELTYLINHESQRLREIEVCERIIEELEEAHLKEGEEEELFKEYTLLAHAEEIGSKVEELCQFLVGERSAVLPHLHRQKSSFDYLTQVDSSLMEVSESFHNALMELQEVANTLNLYQARLESNPQRLKEVSDRLTFITRIKKKYGATLQDVRIFLEDHQIKLKNLIHADLKIEQLNEELSVIKAQNNAMALELTHKRKHSAQKLSDALKTELCSLNMPQVDFQIEVTSVKRGRYGDDRVEFFLLPNVGEHRISIKDCASGGELSRVMLSLQTVLSGKQSIPTLIFDEIDSNIGGETASIVGEKLKRMGQDQQVLCITHFPQVAKQADFHLQISKRTVGERTVTFINLLNDVTREQEIARMTGNISSH